MLLETQNRSLETYETDPPPSTGTPALNPNRWGSILSGAVSSEAHLRTGNAVSALIDGAETFRMMVADIRATSGSQNDFIYLLGWDITDNFNLTPGLAPIPTSVAELLNAADARGVQVRAMLWAKPVAGNLLAVRNINRLSHGAAIRDDLTANNNTLSTAEIVRLLVSGGVAVATAATMAVTMRRNLTSILGAHHQKVLIVKHGEHLVAYCGGVDINENRLNAVGANDPQHDVHCRIIGPSAWDLLQTFIKRWRHHPDSAAIDTGSKGPLFGATHAIPSPMTSPSTTDAPFGGTASTMIARTFNPARTVSGSPAVVRERDIRDGVLAAISHAQRFIYFEDQYLIDMEVAAALNRALPRLQHVTILIPGNDITEGGHPFIQEYRRDFVTRVLSGLSTSNAAKLRVFQLSRSPTALTFGNHTYVHAKTWIVDDELAIIGSANCNRRGYQHDSETDAFIFGSTSPWNGASSFAQAYRMRLWHEHLGVPLARVRDGASSASLWQTASRPATARVFEFDHRTSSSGLISGAYQAARDQAAIAMHRYIDPPMP